MVKYFSDWVKRPSFYLWIFLLLADSWVSTDVGAIFYLMGCVIFLLMHHYEYNALGIGSYKRERLKAYLTFLNMSRNPFNSDLVRSKLFEVAIQNRDEYERV